MATFIKAGFWEKLCKPCKGYKGWLNLDEFVDSRIPAPTPPAYKVYTALLSQIGGNPPTAQVLENTLGGPVTYDYLSPGNYEIILPSSFSNIWVSLTNNNAGSDGILEYDINGFPTNTIILQSNEFNTGSPADINLANGVLYLTSIEIRVYN